MAYAVLSEESMEGATASCSIRASLVKMRCVLRHEGTQKARQHM